MSRLETRLEAALDWAVNALFPCWHRKITKPFTDRKSKSTTVTCLSCGRKFAYDWLKMRVIWKE